MFSLLAGLCGVVSIWNLSVEMETPRPVPFAAQVSAVLHGLATVRSLFPLRRAQLSCARVPSCPSPFGIISAAELCVSGKKKV